MSSRYIAFMFANRTATTTFGKPWAMHAGVSNEMQSIALLWRSLMQGGVVLSETGISFIPVHER